MMVNTIKHIEDFSGRTGLSFQYELRECLLTLKLYEIALSLMESDG